MAAALVGAPAASASIEAGDDCVANTAEGVFTLVPIARASFSPLPLTTPVGGVVTSWKVNSALTEPLVERMRVARPTGSPNEFFIVGESNEGTVSEGTNVFPTRIPVQAGDRFAVIEPDGDGFGFGDSSSGSTAAPKPSGPSTARRICSACLGNL